MCFTINIHTTRNAIEKRYRVDTSALQDFEFRYLYKAFDQPLIPVISQHEPQKVILAHWGLIPHWVKDQDQAEMIRKGTYNARMESLTSKSSFRDAYRSGRCWVIVKGFFEWQHILKDRIPWYIKLSNEGLFSLAGLMSEWIDPAIGQKILTFSIVTAPANPLMEKIHNTKKRMPVILDPSEEQNWLDPLKNNAFESSLKSFDQDKMEAYTVNRNISSLSADPTDARILEKVAYDQNNLLF